MNDGPLPEGIDAAHEGDFAARVYRATNGIAKMLVAKNRSYGDAVLNPMKVFSRAEPGQAILVRIDDKLSRIARGTEFPGDNDIDDLIGYLVLLKLERQRANPPVAPQ